jgi:hypothetical protein
MHVQPPGSFEPQAAGGRRRGAVFAVLGEASVSATLIEPAALDARLRADPLADETMARILGAWTDGAPSLPRWETVALVEREMAGWTTNGALEGWQADAATPAPVAAALEEFVRQARSLPAWADPGKIGCAEAVLTDAGPMACALLACAGLPESLTARSGTEQDAGDALRGAAGLVFATMSRGGLLDAAGAGLARVLRLRLTHAMTRHLIVRGNPAEALAYGAAIPPLLPEGAGTQRALFARGWDLRAHGLPCNQEALAHTLLSFHYVFLRSLRRLGLGLSKEEEGAWLHAWNVVGHLLGIEHGLLAGTMTEAAGLFTRLQRDVRLAGGAKPTLAPGLVHMMRGAIGARALKPLPVLVARRLGLDGQVSWFSRALFAFGMGAALVIDTVMRLPFPGVSIARLVMRLLGCRIAADFLADAAPRDWDLDPHAPHWLQAIEGRFRPGRAENAGREAAA